jgi:hypothetical protein
MVDFGSFRALALACALIVAFAGPLAAAESDETDPTTEETGGLDSYDKLLAAALDGEPAARGALLALFNDLRGDSVAIAELAVQLIGALDGDAVAVIDAATMIADVASHTLSTRPIVRVSVGDNLVLPPGAMGWDFGAPDSVGFEGFRKVTAADQDIVPGAQGDLQSTGGDDLLSDGLLNLHKFFVTVPDGTYRLILLTDASGNLTLASPLGDAIMVNGLRIPMPDGGSDSWQGNGVLGGGQNAGGAQGGGGATMMTVEVVGGQLVLEFLPAEGQNIFLSGIILEPIEGPSVLDMPDVFTDIEEILSAEAIIAEAIGATLENIATAAGGDEGAVDDIINVDEVATEETNPVSPS